VLSRQAALRLSQHMGERFEAPVAPRNALARLYVFRPDVSERNRGDEPTLLVDGRPISILSIDTYTDLELAPGTHTIAVNPQPLQSSIWNGATKVELETGSIHFLAIWNSTEFVSGYSNIFIPGPVPILVPSQRLVRTRSTGVTFEIVPESEASPLIKGKSSVRILPPGLAK
jgi:hypothetical protein